MVYSACMTNCYLHLYMHLILLLLGIILYSQREKFRCIFVLQKHFTEFIFANMVKVAIS